MEQIWFQDPRGFINESNYFTFFPSSTMTFAEQLNAIMRFSVYVSVVILIIKRDSNILFAPILMGILTFLMWNVDAEHKANDVKVLETLGMCQEKSTRKVCQPPTQENPFMNVLMSDYKDNPKRPAACQFKGRAKKEATTYFNHNLYRDVDDVFRKNASDRQFYTMPSTTIPNEAGTFAKWLYEVPQTCKEGSGTKCYRNMYNNHNR